MKYKRDKPLWYYRDGTPSDSYKYEAGSKEWLKESKKINDLLGNYEYKKVDHTKLWWGGAVSTVWLGLDHRFMSEGPPLIFETMVFRSKKNYSGEYQERYSTEEEAIKGHKQTVANWSNPLYVIWYEVTYWIEWKLFFIKAKLRRIYVK